MPEATCDIGLIGLAVMGQNLVLNMTDHGFKVAVFNRTTSKVDEFLADEAKGTPIEGAHSILYASHDIETGVLEFQVPRIHREELAVAVRVCQLSRKR